MLDLMTLYIQHNENSLYASPAKAITGSAKSKILIHFFKIYNINGQEQNFQKLLYHLLSSHKSFISNK